MSVRAAPTASAGRAVLREPKNQMRLAYPVDSDVTTGLIRMSESGVITGSLEVLQYGLSEKRYGKCTLSSMPKASRI